MSKIKADIVPRSTSFFPDKFNIVCLEKLVGKSKFQLKTYAEDARQHHLINACNRYKSCTVGNVHEMATSIMQAKWAVRKNDLVLVEEEEQHGANTLQQASTLGEVHVLSRANFYPGHLKMNNEERSIVEKLVAELSSTIGYSTSCIHVQLGLVAGFKHPGKNDEDSGQKVSRFGMMEMVPCSLDFTGKGTLRDGEAEEFCVAPSDPMQTCTAIGCCDDDSDDEDQWSNIQFSDEGTLPEDIVESLHEAEDAVFGHEGKEEKIKEIEKEGEEEEQQDGTTFIRKAEKNALLVQVQILHRAGFHTAELTKSTAEDDQQKEQRKQKQVQRYRQVLVSVNL